MVCAFACSSNDASLLVDLRTDLVPAAEFDGVVVELEGFGMEDTFPRTGDDFIAGQRVAEFDVPSGTYSGELRLFRRGDPVLSRSFVVTVQDRTGVTLLITRECAGVFCGDPSALACLDGRCVPDTCTVETPELCPPAECTRDDECDAPVAACGAARCVDGVCFETDDGSCDEGEYCEVNVGCIRVDEDAGALDAGFDGGTDSGTDAGDAGIGADADTGTDAGDAGAVCSPGTPSISITAPTGSGRFTPTEAPLRVGWSSTGIAGDVRVEVFGADNDIDVMVDACAGEYTTPSLFDCLCTIRVSASGVVADEITYDVTTD